MSTRPTKGTAPRGPCKIHRVRTAVNESAHESMDFADLADFYSMIGSLAIGCAGAILATDVERLYVYIHWVVVAR